MKRRTKLVEIQSIWRVNKNAHQTNKNDDMLFMDRIYLYSDDVDFFFS